GTSFPPPIDEGQDQQEDHRDSAEQIAPERGVEIRLERRAGPDHKLRKDVRDFQKAPGKEEIPVRDNELRDLRAPGRSEERRDERGEEEQASEEEEDQYEVPGRFLREERDPGLMVGPRGHVLAGGARLPLHGISLHPLIFHE